MFDLEKSKVFRKPSLAVILVTIFGTLTFGSKLLSAQDLSLIHI